MKGPNIPTPEVTTEYIPSFLMTPQGFSQMIFVMTVSGKSGSVTVTSEAGFSFNVSEYTQEELTDKAHRFELEKCGSAVICTDFAMAGVGSNSCGPILAEKYRVPLKGFKGTICFEFA